MKSLRELALDVLATHCTHLPNYNVLDKNLGPGGHCYIDQVYESLLAPYRIPSRKVLEIGVHNGGSMLLWQRYFPNAEIHGLDLDPKPFFQDKHDRIELAVCDAYTLETVNALPNDYDVIIDDGAHTLDTMRFFVKNYLAKLAVNGVMIIEDIPEPEWIKVLMQDLSLNGYRTRIQAFDLRNINLRYDDMMLVVQRL